MGVSTGGPRSPRNPGPGWGYRFLRAADFVLPEWVFRPARAIGTLVAVAALPSQRAHSRQYLRTVLRREPSWREVFRHFLAFEEALMQRLRVANGRRHECEYAENCGAFRRWIDEQTPVLLGTMHVGISDTLGFQLAARLRHPVYLVRQRVGNSHDTEALAQRFGPGLRFIWINDPHQMIHALKDALATPSAVAIQCDRFEPRTRTEAFDFLGAKRLFPFTIYHLALIFDRPVLLSFGVPIRSGRSRLYASPLFRGEPGESRESALRRARAHFQDFLNLLERTLHEHPFLWFNFVPLNPPTGRVAEPEAALR
jgi:predicted LPLAT superfamily acyltransferase